MKKIVIGLLTVAPLFSYAGTMSAATTTRDCYQFNVSDIPADSKYTYAIFRSGKLVSKGDGLTSKNNTLYFCEDEPRVHESIYDNPSDAMRPYANSQYATHEYCTDVYKGFEDVYSNAYKIIIDGIKVDTGAEDAKVEFDFSISHNLVSKASHDYDRIGTSVGTLKDDVKISLISPAFTVVNDIAKIFNVKVVTSDMVNLNQGSPYDGYSTPVLDRTNVFNPKIYSATNVYYFYTSLPSIQSNIPASQLNISKKDVELTIDYSGGDTNDNKIKYVDSKNVRLPLLSEITPFSNPDIDGYVSSSDNGGINVSEFDSNSFKTGGNIKCSGFYVNKNKLIGYCLETIHSVNTANPLDYANCQPILKVEYDLPSSCSSRSFTFDNSGKLICR